MSAFHPEDARRERVREAALATLRQLDESYSARGRGPSIVLGGSPQGDTDRGDLVTLAIATAALAAPSALFGACWCGAPLQFEGHQDGSLHVCCTGADHHCFKP